MGNVKVERPVYNLYDRSPCACVYVTHTHNGGLVIIFNWNTRLSEFINTLQMQKVFWAFSANVVIKSNYLLYRFLCTIVLLPLLLRLWLDNVLVTKAHNMASFTLCNSANLICSRKWYIIRNITWGEMVYDNYIK